MAGMGSIATATRYPPANKLALPPLAVVSIVVTRSVAKRAT